MYSTEGEHVLVIRTTETSFMLRILKRLQGLRERDVKSVFRELESDVLNANH